MAGKVEIRLYELAEDQGGFITTPQAVAQGVDRRTLVMMAERGTLERYSRGVYRFVRFPHDRWSQHWTAVLWPLIPGTVLSHDTALGLYRMSDVLPSKMHITIPMGDRIRRTPPSELVLHRAHLSAEDIAMVHGLPVTTPVRSIRDAAQRHLGPALVRQAILDGARLGLLSRAEAMTVWEEEVPNVSVQELASLFAERS